MFVFLWYTFSGFILKLVSPAFGRLTAQDQSIFLSYKFLELEGEYRSIHA